MATQRSPGPVGSETTPVPLDSGTLALCVMPAPGPILAAASRQARQPQSAAPGKPADTPKPEPLPEDRILQALPDRIRDFLFAGRTLRLIRRRDWRSFQKEERYQVVPADDAKEILQSLAAVTVSKSEKAALEEAIPMLPARGIVSDSSRLLLLRLTPTRHHAPSSSGPAMTPSQIARSQVKAQHWIEIQLVDEDGAGIPGADYVIVTPDNERHSGVTGKNGIARLDDIPPGQCRITFPELDRDAWRAA